MIRSSDVAEIERRRAEVPYGMGKYADPILLLARKEGTGEPWSLLGAGGTLQRALVPDDWRHWKNVYIWHKLPSYDREPIENGNALVSWPLAEWMEERFDPDDYVGLYVRRPAQKWRDLVERIGLDDEIYETDQMAGYLEENIEEIMATALNDGSAGGGVR